MIDVAINIGIVVIVATLLAAVAFAHDRRQIR